MHIIPTFKLLLAWSVDSKRYGGAEDARVAPGAFAGWSPDIQPDKILCAQGYSKNSETLFAHGVTQFLDEIFLDEKAELKDDQDSFRLVVVVKNAGTGTYLQQHIPTWLSKSEQNSSGRTPSSFPIWKRVYLLCKWGKVLIRVTDGIEEKNQLSKLSEVARKSLPDIADPRPMESEAISETRYLEWQI